MFTYASIFSMSLSKLWRHWFKSMGPRSLKLLRVAEVGGHRVGFQARYLYSRLEDDLVLARKPEIANVHTSKPIKAHNLCTCC